MEIATLVGDTQGVPNNLIDHIEHFSPNVRDIFDGFRVIDNQGPGRGQQLPR